MSSATGRIRHFRETARITTAEWRRKLIYWGGSVMVGIVAVTFATLADDAAKLRHHVLDYSPWLILIITPGGLALSIWLTRTYFRGAQGSGIPQAIACMHLSDGDVVNRVLSLKIAAAKILLTCLGLFAGASIGREGPTVQVGAAIMNAVGRFTDIGDALSRRALVLTGGAAGVAAAFNTPLAGIVFGIEELAHSFEQRTSGVVLAGVVLAGVTAIALVGNYSYFGHTDSVVPVGASWLAVIACGLLGGITGGTFSAILIRASRGLPGTAGRFIAQHPIAFAALCGLVLAVIGLASGGMTYGTGYAQARAIIQGEEHYPASYFILKYIATIVSYCSGIPGGLFAPSLSVGAGMGGWVAQFLPQTTPGAVVLLGTVAYFSAVVQAPLTATVIVMEMCDNQQVTLALLASSFLAFGVSRMICKQPLYGALAERFLRTVSPESVPAEREEKPEKRDNPGL
ncbi:chloride channel protein [Acetobacter oeni]|uniref:Chloride channel protein n=1 Tax=Acetobacter oeni TaxID=304077 RepID=A0A511XHB3_9PROT|nr:chloride channel protein [Acetobacter oeni]MBB3881181.1 H+/Cl- antiporter ClcA [Acetobacter oeni]NHO18058.1 chloride channel protein [Acetobacter oeni]GBR08444.1 chloride channel protein [Acetobacter oeni LMG 21952]GEN62334.1 chloride channel protein [Acetobacter oeni]